MKCSYFASGSSAGYCFATASFRQTSFGGDGAFCTKSLFFAKPYRCIVSAYSSRFYLACVTFIGYATIIGVVWFTEETAVKRVGAYN